jgi:hypothetical protein
MRESDVKQFLRLCGIKDSQMVCERGYVNSICPLSPWTHESGRDTRPSFGIKVNDDGESMYYCFSCQTDGRNLSWMLHNFWLFEKEYPYELAQFFAEHEIFRNPENDEHMFNSDPWGRETKEIVIPEPLPMSVVSRFPLLQGAGDAPSSSCLSYLTYERNLEPTVIFYSGVRYDPSNRTVIYPMTSRKGEIYLLRARSIFEKKMWTISPKVLNLPEDTKFPTLRQFGAWFGLDLVDWTKPIMIVEGGEDRLRLLSLGYWNVVASMTTGFTDAQLQSLLSAPALIVGYDDDKAGQDSYVKILSKYRKDVPIFRVHWKEAGIGSKGEPCKDAGDLVSKEQLFKVLENISDN